jgi:hypothetical protein
MIEFALYACLGLSAISAANWIHDTRGEPWGMIMALCGIVLIACAITTGRYELGHLSARNHKAWETAKISGDLAMKQVNNVTLQIISGMTAEQLALVGRIHASLILEPGVGGVEPEECILLGDNELIPRAVVKAFVRDCGPAYLCPVGHYSADTLERHAAELMTKFMVDNRYAEPAAGNKSARWLLREAGLRAIGEWME